MEATFSRALLRSSAFITGTNSTAASTFKKSGWLMRKPRDAANSDAVVIGDPQLFGALPQLPGARREAERVGDRYGVEPLLGSAATEKQLRANVGDGVQIPHIASHAEFRSDRPLQSALILSGNGNIVRLTAERIFQRPIPARLVVLSACETGAGRVVAGDDILGLPRSFYLGRRNHRHQQPVAGHGRGHAGLHDGVSRRAEKWRCRLILVGCPRSASTRRLSPTRLWRLRGRRFTQALAGKPCRPGWMKIHCGSRPR